MANKIIRLTESDLEKIVRRVIKEQPTVGKPIIGDLRTVNTVETDAKNRTYKVIGVTGKGAVDGKLVQVGTIIRPTSKIAIEKDTQITMKSISKEDAGTYFQNVVLNGENGKLTLTVLRGA